MKEAKQMTSDTHPILIDFVAHQWKDSSKLGITFAPGKVQPSGWAGNWNRNLKKDINRIKQDYRIQTLVSLIEKQEMIQLKIQNQIQECINQGLNAYHFPIPDQQSPKNQEQFKKLVVHIVNDHLRTGKNVVVHCKGGLGRAPTFAISCLIYSGLSYQKSLQMVKMSRKSAHPSAPQRKFLSTLKF